jgi:nitroreductase
MPLPVRSDTAIQRLAQRRSVPAQDIAAPAPSDADLLDMITLAARSPDHGKLAPWRFVILAAETKARILPTLETLAMEQDAPDKAAKVLMKLAAPPATVIVISAPVASLKVPVWEQELSAGAVCMNLIHAADAMGYVCNWITDWYAYDPRASALFGVKDGERIAGFIHIGTAPAPSLERARPDAAGLVTRL